MIHHCNLGMVFAYCVLLKKKKADLAIRSLQEGVLQYFSLKKKKVRVIQTTPICHKGNCAQIEKKLNKNL